jgi:uroporphyrinogen-III synthase
MKDLKAIISTKSLSINLLLSLDYRLISMLSLDFIKITPLSFNKKDILNSSNHWIISSKNSINLLLKTYNTEELKQISFYCVGDKTAKIITDNQLSLVTCSSSSASLAENIIKNYSTTNFTFICGEMRRNELERILKNRKIQLNEFNIYSTTLSPSEIRLYPTDGILFFSPSGIKSYVLKNAITTETLFCIGNTTATEAKKHSTNIIIAKNQTIESVIESVKKHYT